MARPSAQGAVPVPLGPTVTGGIQAATVLTGTTAPATANVGGIRRRDENLNVVLILFDDGGLEYFEDRLTTGANYAGLAVPSAGLFKMPRLQEMMARGVSFTRAYAMPICGPTRARVMSGVHAFRNTPGGTFAGNIAADYGFAYGAVWGPAAVTPVATLLARAARAGRQGTADQSIGALQFTHSISWFGKCHMMSNAGTETYPVNMGAGRYVGCQPNAASMVNWPVGQFEPNPGSSDDSNSGHYHFREIAHSYGGAVSSYTYGDSTPWAEGAGNEKYVAWDPTQIPTKAAWDAYKNTRDAIQWINTRTQPFLTVLALNPPHSPYEIPPYTAPDDVGEGAPGGTLNLLSTATQAQMAALDGGNKGPGYRPTAGTSIQQVFRANAEAVDSLIGLLWDRMTPAIRDKTVFVFLGDNGTVAQAVSAPYDALHAKRTLYEQGQRVPLVIWGPPSVIGTPGRTSNHLVHCVDIFSTVLDVLQAESALWNPGAAIKVDGRSLLRVMGDAAAPAVRDHIYCEMFVPLGASRNGEIPIDPTQWSASYMDGIYKIIRKPSGSVPPYEFYRIDSTLQPVSLQPGYLELANDNLYGLVNTPGQETLTARFNALVASMNALQAS